MAGPAHISTIADEKRVPIDRVLSPFRRFFRIEAAGGIVLIIATIIAMVWANTGFHESYVKLFEKTKFTVDVGGFGLSKALILWINDLLMAAFFLLVGLEVKREILVGELSSPRRAALPIAGALGGMVVPAGVYVAITMGTPDIRAWGVPMATDIAFALGMLALLGTRVPIALRVFLASLAIADDIGALLVIALFYTADLDTQALAAAGGICVVLIILNTVGVRALYPYLLIGLGLWYALLVSGVHATLAGVLVAAAIPASALAEKSLFLARARESLDRVVGDEEKLQYSESDRVEVIRVRENCRHVLPPLHRLEVALLPIVAFLIVPVFALANAGVRVTDLSGLASKPALGIMLGLLVGKPVGIVLFSFIAVKLKLGDLPRGSTWMHVVGAGFLAGIGFTMAIFIANLAFEDAAGLANAKLAILAASTVSAVAGLAMLWLASTRTTQPS